MQLFSYIKSRFGASSASEEKAVRYESRRQGHEPPSHVGAGGIVAATTGLLVLVALVLWIVAGFFDKVQDFQRAERAVPFAEYDAVPPEPRLQQDPSVELHEVRDRENELLHTFGRLEGSFARIPIERAMQLLLERGLPVDTSRGMSDSIEVITGAGFTMYTPGPPPPTSPAMLGTSPEPYFPDVEPAKQFLPPDTLTPRLPLD